MQSAMKRARFIAAPPMERVDSSIGDGSTPEVGDIVELDQGFTFPDGRAGGTVFSVTAEGHIKWSADVLDSEIELLSS
jgi:hypothetical protein